MNDLVVAGLSASGILKLGFIVVFAIYVIFALVVVRQVTLMEETLNIGFDKFIKGIALAHLAFIVTLFLLSFMIL